MKDVNKVSITLTSPTGRTRVITAVSINPAQNNPNFAHSDADMNGDVVTILTRSTASAYEVVVRQNSGHFNFLNNFIQDCMDESSLGTGLFKNTSKKGSPEVHVLGGVSVAQKESGQHDNSNVVATFSILVENVERRAI